MLLLNEALPQLAAPKLPVPLTAPAVQGGHKQRDWLVTADVSTQGSAVSPPEEHFLNSGVGGGGTTPCFLIY